MKLKLLITLILVLKIISTNGVTLADDKDIFLNKCGSCHRKNGKAPPINPADKAALVWKRYFKRKRHPIDLSKYMTAEELQQIIKYLQDHAADSDKPEAAVIPK